MQAEKFTEITLIPQKLLINLRKLKPLMEKKVIKHLIFQSALKKLSQIRVVK